MYDPLQMKNYYFLITAFPPLALGKKPEFSFKELESLLKLNLSESDIDKVKELLRPIDIYNIRAYFLGMPLDDRGNISSRELEEELLVKEDLPSYVIDFLDHYESTEERLKFFSSLYVSMYNNCISHSTGFLLKYFIFERELRLVLTGLRAKASGKDIVRELQFEDSSDPLVLEILSQKDMPEFTPPKEYEDLKNLFIANLEDPQKLNRAILEYRFQRYQDMEEPQEFGIDRVLSFIAKFLLVESLALLDEEKGMEQLSHYE